MNIKDIIKDNVVTFAMYRNDIFYYNVRYDSKLFLFPVSREDIGNATLKRQDKAILFMRYIREALDNKTFIET